MGSRYTMHYLKKLYIFFIILALTIFFFSTTKVESKSFEIKNIEISEPFANNFDKKTVFDKGFKEAFSELIYILTKSSDFKKVENIKLKEIKSMINSFSIQEEKFIDQTYYVNLGVSFNKKRIFEYLEKKNIFPSQINKKKFLFIPILIDEKITDLTIFSNNQIYDNWNIYLQKYHLIEYILPTEDLEDLTLIKKNYDDIEKYDFKEILKKYYLDDGIIALIFKNESKLRVLSKIITKNKVVIKNDTFDDLDFRDPQKIEYLINYLKRTYEDTWKEYNQINTSIKLPLVIRVDYQDFKKITNFEKILNELDLVNYFSIQKFSKKDIFYEIIFNGTPNDFINLMKTKNYLFNTEKKIWILK